MTVVALVAARGSRVRGCRVALEVAVLRRCVASAAAVALVWAVGWFVRMRLGVRRFAGACWDGLFADLSEVHQPLAGSVPGAGWERWRLAVRSAMAYDRVADLGVEARRSGLRIEEASMGC